MRRALLFLLATMLGSLSHAQPQWDPARTYVLIASVIEWPAAAKLAPFLSERRRDEDLAEQFRACGVPAGQVVFLKDAAATRGAIREQLAALAQGAGPGSTLIFYVQGHGSRRSFLCYDFDAARPGETAFHVDEIAPLLHPAWQGERLLLIGDCCSSGALARAVQQLEERRPELRAACLASSTASNKSTERWTFTASLIRLLAGEPRADRDGDGRLTFAEAGSYLKERMKFEENQLALVARSRAFEADFVLRAAAPAAPAPPRLPGPWQIGDVVDAQDKEGKWYASEILAWDEAKGRYRVHYYGWDSKWDEWVEPARVRRLVKKQLEVGRQYEVQWQDKRWYLGTIVRAQDDWFYFVHYAGEAGQDDEWITAERARPVGAEGQRQRVEFAAEPPVRQIAAGQIVAAQWNRQWWRGRVRAFEDGLYAVRYDDETDGTLALDELIPIAPAAVRVGDRVLACWAGKARMYPGRVEKIGPKAATIRWEDGTAPTEVPLEAVARIR
ncbi:MAG: caspase family protein [Verrucomicrobia bacterium]|nr:caspase family protein [Verrucomicrobiota bacterium]